MTEKPLAELKPGEIAEIVALNGGDEFQSRLRAMGLAEGQTVRKLSRIRWGGPIVLLVNRAQVAVGRGMAKKITVRVRDKNKGGDRGAEDNG
jgi:ferrous iron transport protein A